jgi:hypothetical protein
MSDPLRNDTLHDREAHIRIEELLVAGLDCYFAGELEASIHIWTRVLFLDRGHARARAYIERARSAVAERQRESEELVHRGVAAFNEGDAGAARRLLTRAVEGGASDTEALAVLGRLDRLEPHPQAAPDGVLPRVQARRRPAQEQAGLPETVAPRERAWVTAAAVILLALFAGAGLVLSGAVAVPDFRFETAANGDALGRPDEPLPVPSASEVTLARAKALFDRGRLREALRALDAVSGGDAREPEANGLRANIQRALLATAGPGGLPVPR